MLYYCLIIIHLSPIPPCLAILCIHSVSHLFLNCQALYTRPPISYAHRHGEELRKIIQKENEENKKKAEAEESNVRALAATALAVPATAEAAVLPENEDPGPAIALANADQKQPYQSNKQQPGGTVVVTLDGKLAGVSTARSAAGTTRRISGMGDRNDM